MFREPVLGGCDCELIIDAWCHIEALMMRKPVLGGCDCELIMDAWCHNEALIMSLQLIMSYNLRIERHIQIG